MIIRYKVVVEKEKMGFSEIYFIWYDICSILISVEIVYVVVIVGNVYVGEFSLEIS